MNVPPAGTAEGREAAVGFRAAYCRKHGCADEAFLHRALWTSLYPSAQIVALIAGPRAEWFALDRALIDYCGRLTSLDEIDAELAEFSSAGRRGFVRRFFRIRVSGRRLRKLAACCLRP